MTIIGLKMMVKSGLEFFFEIPSARSELLLPSAEKLPRKAKLAWLGSKYLWRGMWNFKKKILDHFSTSFLSKNGHFKT